MKKRRSLRPEASPTTTPPPSSVSVAIDPAPALDAGDALAPLVAAALAAPTDAGAWDALEEAAAAAQRPEVVADALLHVLSDPATAAADATLLGQRAVRLHDEWFDTPDRLIKVLDRVLARDAEAAWAFERTVLALTVAARWDDLLAAYDRVLARVEDKARRAQLLDEAAHVAKDFAGSGERAIQYLQALLPLRPADAQLATSLERLLERQGRHRDLIDLWNARIAVLSRDGRLATRARVAACWLDKLHQPEEALAVCEILLSEDPHDTAGSKILERIATTESASADVRRKSLELLKQRYAAGKRSADVVRVLEISLDGASPAQQAEIHSEIIDRLLELGRDDAALEHCAALVKLKPASDEARDRLRQIAEKTGRHDRRAAALAAAVDGEVDEPVEVALLVEAGTVRVDLLSDDAGAADAFARAFASKCCTGPTRLEVARRLDVLYDRTGKSDERLLVLEALADLEESADKSRDALARAASLAAARGETDRALAAWERRLTADASDAEALDAIVEVLHRAGRFQALVEALRRRIDATANDARKRADLLRIAELRERELDDIDGAIETMRSIETSFGATAELVDGLARLFAAAKRFDDLAVHLGAAADREEDPRRRADLLARLGDVHREQLSALDVASTHYRAALAVEPTHAGSRAGLRAILERADDDRVRADAAAALADAYRSTDDWAALLEIVEHRLAVARRDTERAAVLIEAARLHEQRAGDPVAALNAVARAFPLTPSDASLEVELVRLADATTNWTVAIDALGAGIAACGDDALRAATLRVQQGALLEHRVGDLARALDAYLPVIAVFPESSEATEAVVRVAGRVGRWEDAARALAESAVAQRQLDFNAASTYEWVAAEREAWDAAVNALESAVDRAAGLPPGIARELEAQIAAWHRDRRDDVARAEKAYLRAIGHDPSDPETLKALAVLQRRHPDGALLDTLLQLATTTDDDLGVLFEAAQVALEITVERERAISILERLLVTAATRWTRTPHNLPTLPPTSAPVRPSHYPGEESRDLSSDSFSAWALDKLVVLFVDAGEHQRAVDALVAGARMPFQAPAALSLRHRAAELAAANLGDPRTAIGLYREILEAVPDDARATAALVRLYEASELWSELAALRRHELGLAKMLDARLRLRIELARVLARSDDADGELEALKANLEEQPGDRDTIDLAIESLDRRGKHDELTNLLSEQALILESAGDSARAAELWARVAQFSESPLGDVARALASWGRVVALGPTAEAYDALARLHASRRESAVAIEWLKKRLEATAPGARGATVGKLAAEHLRAGERSRALEVLRDGLADEPGARGLRELLAAQFREAQAWPALAELLRDGAQHEQDLVVRIEWLREAAEIHVRSLDEPSAAVPLLEEAGDLAEKLGPTPAGGKDRVRPLRVALADALRRAGRHDEARVILDGLVEWYGRRRPPERARVHVQLAHLASAREDAAEALAQLELASTMDMGSAEILGLLGSKAREAGDFTRAERAYRALLLIVRRAGAVLDAPIGPSEVLFELHRIASALGQEDRARENLESAFEAASQNEAEGQRFVQLLRETGNEAFLVRALQARVEVEQDPNAAAATLIELADVLDGLGRVDEALQARLDALAHVPDSIALHAAVRDVARRAGKLERYEERLRALAERASEAGESTAAAGFFLRLGEVLEQDLGDLDRAAAAYARAEATGEQTVAVQRGIARVARTRGDREAEAVALRQIVQIDEQDPALRTEALYRLAELCLGSEATRAEGAEMLSWAVDRDAQLDRALGMLRAVAGDDERIAELQERVARASGDPALLLEAIERLSSAASPSLDILREGCELAIKSGDAARAEKLLRRTIEVARASESMPDAAWALIALADLRRAAGDATSAIAFLLEASDASSGDAYDLRLSAASLAAGPGDDLPLAARTYESLLERDAGDQRVWGPLLDVLRRLGDRVRLERLIADTIENVFDASERNVLRLERVRLLLDGQGREQEAATSLNEILEDEPDQEGAATMLMDLYQRLGRDSELDDLVRNRLALARDRGDLPRVAELSLRLGALLEPKGREEALEVYREASALVPEDRPLLQAQVKLLKPTDDPAMRAETMERLLALETGDVAAAMALEVANVRQTMNDDEGVVRVLERGFRESPTNERLRLRLEKLLTAREDFLRLADVYTLDARSRRDKRAALARFREAAKLQLERLNDPRTAAAVLGEARELAPDDVNLLVDLSLARGVAGEFDRGIDEITSALEGGKHGEAARVTLLRARSELRLGANDSARAVEDLESAYAIGGAAVAPDLIAALDRRRTAAAARKDLPVEREAVNRLVEVLCATSDLDRAHQVLVDWIGRDPADKDALRTLAAVDHQRGDDSGVVDAYLRLVRIEQGTPQADAALALADAADRAGRQEEARNALEHSIRDNPADDRLRARLRVVYEAVGAFGELAALTLLDAEQAEDPGTKFDLLIAAGDLFLRSVGEESSAIAPLEQALTLKPFHHEATLLLADAYTLSSEIDRAMELLTPAIEKHKNRRSKELAALQHRMARAANAGGGRDVELQWLVKALECDMQNGQVAAELAEVAIELRQFEVALKALKAVTLLRTPGPMSRALATLRQGQIAYQQGDPKRAVLLAKKALAEEPSLDEAGEFLRELGA